MMRRIREKKAERRSAFTLIEMLVAVTLVLLIMSMFAVFLGVATDMVRNQRGIAANDQRARALVTVLKADFAKRTQRYPLPFFPTEKETTSPTSFAKRRGYLYISCNDPNSHHDDLIQFTVDARVLNESQDSTRYFGAASLLSIGDGIAPDTIVDSPNQPEADDRNIGANGTASSDAAEIAIFMRNNKLYRRVMLLRDPIDVPGDVQPQTPDGTPFFQPDTGDGTGGFFYTGGAKERDFWRQFDFSAVPVVAQDRPVNVQFVGLSALNNEVTGGEVTSSGRPLKLGIPMNRFGFNPLFTNNAETIGCASREHDSLANGRFLGRWLHAETSDSAFTYPIAPVAVGAGNPMDVITFPVTLPVGADVVTEFGGSLGRGGVRRMEDLLLTNVESFQVEIWDERLGRFVVPGYGSLDPTEPGIVGDFHIRRCLQYDENTVTFRYGPIIDQWNAGTPVAPYPHVFDTWYAAVGDLNDDGVTDLAETLPPYLPYDYYPPNRNDSPPGPSPMDAPDDGSKIDYWKESFVYGDGEVVFARNSINAEYPGWDADKDGVFNWESDAAYAVANNLPPLPPQGFQIAYRCIVGGTSGSVPPTWPTVPGQIVQDGGVTWLAVDNRRPLRSVRLTIRFRDVPSDKIRQLTLVVPLVDD